MARILRTIITATALTLAATSVNAAPDLRDLLKGINTEDIINGIGQTIANATATSKFTVDDLVGTWKYQSPGIAFKGDNTLANIGGAAAATTIENRLAPYYKKAKLTNITLTVDSQHNFAFKTTYGTFKGTVSKQSGSETLTFNFNVLGKVSIGHIDAIATKAGNQLNITFDASRLIEILKKLPKVTSNASFSTISSILDNYDNIYIGFRMTCK